MAVLDSRIDNRQILAKFGGKFFDNHEFIISLNDKKSGLKAYVAVHNTNLGPALGGTRMTYYSSDNDALKDVLNLSKAMSFKCALAKLPYGGGKGVIISDDKLDRDQILIAYGRLVEKLRGLFKTGTDVGISDEDVKRMATQTTYMLGVIEADRGNLSTSNVAALGVFYSMKSSLKALYGSPNFEGKKIAIKGVGKLGAELARLTHQAGANVIIGDIDKSKVDPLIKELQDVTIASADTIHQCDVDIYSPCAMGNDLNPKTIPELRCKAVVGGANNQLADIQSGDLLNKLDILYAPDYISNAGGLIYVADELEPGGFNKERVIKRTKSLEDTLDTIFKQAKQQNAPTHRVADKLALERINGNNK